MSTLRVRSVPRPLAVIVVILVLALAAGALWQTLIRPEQESSSPPNTAPHVEADEPLTGGVKVPVVVATEQLRLCNCPQLPSSGPMSPEHVDLALLDAAGGRLLFRFDSGVDLYYEPETRSEEEYVRGWQEAINDRWPGVLTPLRGTQAAAAERAESGPSPGPAVLDWLEGAYILAMYGNGGQSLAELIQLAESLPPAL